MEVDLQESDQERRLRIASQNCQHPWALALIWVFTVGSLVCLVGGFIQKDLYLAFAWGLFQLVASLTYQGRVLGRVIQRQAKIIKKLRSEGNA